MSDNRGFASMEVSAAVGIQPTLLNKFIDRKRYRIKPSVKRGGRGGERIFSAEDVYGIALVHWLFESGLRSETIQFVLNQICGHLKSGSNDAAAQLVTQKPDVLVVTREPRIGYAKHPDQEVRLCASSEAAKLIGDSTTRSILVIPIANLLTALRARLKNILDSRI